MLDQMNTLFGEIRSTLALDPEGIHMSTTFETFRRVSKEIGRDLTPRYTDSVVRFDRSDSESELSLYEVVTSPLFREARVLDFSSSTPMTATSGRCS